MAGNISYEDLFLGILAMDVYHRGYNSGLKDLGQTGSIGDASIELTAGGIADQAIGFYAIKYRWNEKNIYVYRGTDMGFTYAGDDGDLKNGFSIGGGNPDSNQGNRAIEFFTAGEGKSPSNQNAIVAGQSLGGGLAGYIASLYHVRAAIFNNMAFELAAQNAYDVSRGDSESLQENNNDLYDWQVDLGRSLSGINFAEYDDLLARKAQ